MVRSSGFYATIEAENCLLSSLKLLQFSKRALAIEKIPTTYGV